ncbi:MAG TPA: NAD(P)H-binding protein [Thermoplasmata archaeon]|nr:NAD(P)H-binding protein [Thermoplasmata archaeon]
MTAAGPNGPRMLVVGGCGGFVGRAILDEFASDRTIRSYHRARVPAEASRGVEWVPGDAAATADWGPLVAGVDTVLNLAWYRQARARRFRTLAAGLHGLVRASEAAGVRRFVHVSVPPAPPALETGLPYLAWKRSVDRALAASRLDYAIVRPTMLFGPSDKLATVMLRTIARYHRFPMFGDGGYHVAPIAVADLARAIRLEGDRGGRRTIDLGGPRRYRYRELTDRMFAALGREPRYLQLSARGGVRLAALLEALGSSLLYAYEVEWLLSDLLGLPPYDGLDRPLAGIEPFLDREAARLTGRPPPVAAEHG